MRSWIAGLACGVGLGTAIGGAYLASSALLYISGVCCMVAIICNTDRIS